MRLKTTVGEIIFDVKNRVDAARFLMNLHRLGIKVTRWEVI